MLAIFRGGRVSQTPVRPSIRVAGEAELREREDQRLLEVAAVALHVLAVPRQVEDRVADELAGPVEGRLAAAVGLDDLDVGALGDVQLATRSVRRPVVTVGGCSSSRIVSGIAPCETAPASERCSSHASSYGTRPSCIT